MRLQFARVENLLTETFKLLIFTVIIGTPLTGYHHHHQQHQQHSQQHYCSYRFTQTAAMHIAPTTTATTTTTTPTSSSPSSSVTTTTTSAQTPTATVAGMALTSPAATIGASDQLTLANSLSGGGGGTATSKAKQQHQHHHHQPQQQQQYQRSSAAGDASTTPTRKLRATPPTTTPTATTTITAGRRRQRQLMMMTMMAQAAGAGSDTTPASVSSVHYDAMGMPLPLSSSSSSSSSSSLTSLAASSSSLPTPEQAFRTFLLTQTSDMLNESNEIDKAGLTAAAAEVAAIATRDDVEDDEEQLFTAAELVEASAVDTELEPQLLLQQQQQQQQLQAQQRDDVPEMVEQDYIMMKHIVSNQQQQQIIEKTTTTTTNNTNNNKSSNNNNNNKNINVLSKMATITTAMGAQPTEIATTITTTTTTAKASTSGHYNKTLDLSSLSLLSLNDETMFGAAANPKISEHQQQQQHKNANHNSNNNNSKQHSIKHLATNGTTTKTTIPTTATTTATGGNAMSLHGGSGGGGSGVGSEFHQIGSQRIVASKSTAPTVTNAFNGGNTTRTMASGSGTVRVSARKVDGSSSGGADGKFVLPKPQKTDAPMLNYIFDTFSSANKHHHHDQRYGPHFEDMDKESMGQATNMTVQAGSSIHLNCRISLLQDKTVSWVRRNALGENALDLLTVGLHTYTGDKRYKMEFQYPNNWRLKIVNVKKDDEAMYECQISTHPPRVIQINLHVNAPKVMIVDEFGDPLQEKYYEIDSTLQLSCVVRNVAMTTSVVYWRHGEDVLNYDVTRGGVSVKTELMDDGANSTLSIAKIHKADSGNYSCSINEFQNFSIVVHILNGESFAELHHGGAATLAPYSNNNLCRALTMQLLLLIAVLLYSSTSSSSSIRPTQTTITTAGSRTRSSAKYMQHR